MSPAMLSKAGPCSLACRLAGDPSSVRPKRSRSRGGGYPPLALIVWAASARRLARAAWRHGRRLRPIATRAAPVRTCRSEGFRRARSASVLRRSAPPWAAERSHRRQRHLRLGLASCQAGWALRQARRLHRRQRCQVCPGRRHRIEDRCHASSNAGSRCAWGASAASKASTRNSSAMPSRPRPASEMSANAAAAEGACRREQAGRTAMMSSRNAVEITIPSRSHELLKAPREAAISRHRELGTVDALPLERHAPTSPQIEIPGSAGTTDTPAP